MKRILPIVVLFWFLAARAEAATVAEVRLAQTTVRIGETVQAAVVIRSDGTRIALPDTAPEWPAVDGLRVRQTGGVRQNMYQTMAEMRMEISWSYLLTATKTGEITIPAIAVNLGATTLRTAERKLTVLPGASGETALTATVRAGLMESTIAADDSTKLFLVYQNASAPDKAPDWPDIDGAVLGEATRAQDTAGNDVWFWLVHPTRTGLVTIPPLTVPVDGKPVQTASVTLTVERPRILISSMNVSKTTLYVGEAVRASWRVAISAEARLENFSLPWETEMKDWVVRPLDNQPGVDYITIDRRNGTPPLRLGVKRTGQQTEYFVERLLIPWRAGAHTLESGAASARHFFDAGVSYAQPIRLTVLELPAEGRPKGISVPVPVGSFTFAATVEPATVALGETCELVRTVTGTGNLEMIALDPLEETGDFSVYEHTAKLDLNTDELSGKKVFRQAISPRNPRLTALPAQTFAWFDPTDRTYHTAAVPAIPLTVTAAATQPGAYQLPVAAATGTDARAPEKLRDDIGNIMLDGLFERPAPAIHATVWFWTAVLAGMALVVLGELLGRHRTAMGDSIYRRRVRARGVAAAMLAEAAARSAAGACEPAFAMTAGAVRQYLADKAGRAGGELTRTEIVELATRFGWPSALTEDTQNFLADADAGRFGGSPTPEWTHVFMKRAAELLDALEALPWRE